MKYEEACLMNGNAAKSSEPLLPSQDVYGKAAIVSTRGPQGNNDTSDSPANADQNNAATAHTETSDIFGLKPQPNTTSEIPPHPYCHCGSRNTITPDYPQRRSRFSFSLPNINHSSGSQSSFIDPSQELATYYRHGPPRQPPMEQKTASSSNTSDDEPPDGGKLAWLHAWAGFLVVFNAQGLNMVISLLFYHFIPPAKQVPKSYGVFQAWYQGVMLPDKSPAAIAWIGSFQIFLLFFMGIFVSPLIDKGYFRICFNGGSLLLVLSVLVTSFCTKWWQLLVVQGIVTGVAMGLTFCSGVVVLMSYFSKRLGLATGIASCGGSVGALFPSGLLAAEDRLTIQAA